MDQPRDGRDYQVKEYHKILTVFERDPATKYKTLLDGQFAHPALEYLQNNEWIWTEKVDGTNIRVMIPHKHNESYEIMFGGKTSNALIPGFLVQRLQNVFQPQKERLREMFPDGGCLYGEGYGAKIQKGGGNYRSDQDFVLFDVKVGDWWLERHNVEDVASKLGLDVVPIIGTGTLDQMVAVAREGFASQWGDFRAEGIVARPETELMTRNGDRIITKVKTKDFGAAKSNAG